MSYKDNLQQSLSEQKTRVFLFLMLAIIVVVTFFAYTTLSKSVKDEQEDGRPIVSSGVTNPSLGVESIPGVSEPSKEYQKIQKQYEDEKVQEAIKKADAGEPGAALPSLKLADIPEPPKIEGIEPPKPDTSIQNKIDVQKQLQEDRLRLKEAALEQQRIMEENKRAVKLFAKQAAVLADNWKVVPQSYVDGKVKSYPEAPMLQRLKEIRKEKPKADKPKIYYKAGDILFGVVLTSINSDEPGPVLARVISGPLSNSKIIGAINPKSIPSKGTDARVSKSLVLEFSLMNIPGSKRSTPVKAVAIDPQTARTSMATSVNNHYLLRYGSFFAAEFLSGLGQAIQMQGQTKVVTGGGVTNSAVNDSGIATIGRDGKLSNSDEVKIAVGKTAKAFTENLRFLDKPPTIKVAAGTPVGLLLQEDLVIGGEDTDTTALLSNQGGLVNARSLSGQPTVTQDMLPSSQLQQNQASSSVSNNLNPNDVYGIK